MQVLIVEEDRDLGATWARRLAAEDLAVEVVTDGAAALDRLRSAGPRVIIVNVMLTGGCALTVADYASYRWPEARVVFVTDGTAFADGSIFCHAGNAVACLRTGTPPGDLASLVAYHARARDLATGPAG